MSEAGSNVRIVIEKIYDGHPGEGYEVGVERGDRYTQMGWYGKTPEAGLLRLFLSEAAAAKNLAAAVIAHAETMDALAQELAERFDQDLLAQTGPRTAYEVAGEFGSTKMERIERELSELRRQVDDLHRCPHHRRFQSDCYLCPGGFSVGGPLDVVSA